MRKSLSLLTCLFISILAAGQNLQPSGPITLCQGASQTFTVNGAPSGATFTWESSNDGGATWNLISEATASTYEVNTAGSFRVNVTSNGTKTLGPVDVSIASKPTPNFSFNNDNSCSGTSIQFNSNVTNGTAPFKYTWNFGDGATSILQNPTHSYTSLGCGMASFQVTLTVTDANNCSNAITKQITVKQLPDVEVRDEKNTFSQFNNCSNSPSTSDPNFTIILGNISPSASCIDFYSVNWGDGNIQNGLTSANFPLTHIYTQLGTFNLVVSATSKEGCTNSKIYKVVNQSNPAVGISAPGSTTGCAPSGFWFKLKGYEPNSPGTSYTWNFGDNTSVENWTTPVIVDSIFHTFSATSCTEANGQFTVKVTATNGCKSTTATVDNITIFQKPKANFSAPESACASTGVTFTNTTIGGFNQGDCNRNTLFEWDFGDPTSSQNTSTNQSPSHIFSGPRTYTVRLIAEGSCGKDTVKKTICIVPAPVSSFNLSSSSGCAPFSVDAVNTSNALSNCSAATYQWTVGYVSSNCGTTSGWSFANNTSASSVNPSFSFTNPGTYTIKLSVTNACGTVVSTKDVIVKAPPVVSLPGLSNVCGPVSITPTATITNCGSGTLSYQWTFTGGSLASSNSANPGPVSFTTTGTNTISLAVTNECGTTTVSKSFIISPLPDLTVPSNKVFCAGESTGLLSFTSTTPGTTISWTSTTSAIGLSALSGNGSISSFTTVNNSASPIVATITVKATSSNGCITQSSFTITVNPKPATPTVATPITYCVGAIAQPLTATVSEGNTLNWYTTASGGMASATAPTPSTAAAGTTTYYVSQVNPATGCESGRAAIVVNVNASPVISSSTSTNPSRCGIANGSITLNGLSANTTYTVNYTKNGVNQAASLMATGSGALIIQNLSAGVYDHIGVSLAGCASNTAGPHTLTDPDPPAVPTVGSNTPVCSGQTLNLTATSTTPNASYSWTGPNGYTSNVQNPTITTTTAHSGTYTVTVSINGCTSTAPTSVTVNPKPAKPAVTSPVVYCQNETAVPLTAAGSNLTWYTTPGLNSGTATAPTPLTATIGTTTYYVTQTNSFGCESDAAIITITVNSSIGNNTVGSDQTICAGSMAQPLGAASGPAGGTGSFQYQWHLSVDGGASWSSIPGANAAGYSPGTVSQTSQYKRVVNSGSCTNTSNIVTITIQGGLSHYDISASQTICSGTQPLNLAGQIPLGGDGTYGYQWQSSANGTAWNDMAGVTTADYQPPVLTATTYYRRIVKSGSCSATSSVVTITVNPKPAMVAIPNSIHCNNTAAGAISFTSTPNTNVSYAWSNDNTAIGLGGSGSGDLPSFTAVNNSSPKVPLGANITVTPTYTFNGVSCVGNATSFTITVLPKITLAPIKDEVVCTGSLVPEYTPVSDEGANNGSTVRYQWTVSGSGIDLAGGNGDKVPAYTTRNTGTTDLVATITVTPQYIFGGKTCDGTPVSYTVTTKSATPDASAGPDVSLCAASTYTMKAVATPGTSGVWTQTGGSTVTITDPSSPTTTVSGLLPSNSYEFEWTVTGFASCPPTKDAVTITVVPDLVNAIDNTTQTVCYGQPVNIKSVAVSGGSGNYQYQWQQSTDGTNWASIAGQTNADLSFTPAQNMYVRRVVTSAPCEKASAPATIVVQPPVSNNTISTDQNICINTTATILKGSVPAGANGSYLFQWQSSNDGGTTWNDINGATLQDYDPGVLTTTTRFRRNVASSLCSGPQSSNSNVITITVNPDARALFHPAKDSSCAPFNIDASVVQLQAYPDRNGAYEWYANDALIGSGSRFPGYTIPGQRSFCKD